MSIEVFCDTNFWVALFDKMDSLHAIAKEKLNELPEDYHLVTSQFVLGEVLELFAKRSSFIKEELIAFVSEIPDAPSSILEPSTSRLYDDTIAFYQKHTDKDWGFIDCSSFVIMKRRGIKDALTYDKHFIQAGFKALLRG